MRRPSRKKRRRSLVLLQEVISRSVVARVAVEGRARALDLPAVHLPRRYACSDAARSTFLARGERLHLVRWMTMATVTVTAATTARVRSMSRRGPPPGSSSQGEDFKATEGLPAASAVSRTRWSGVSSELRRDLGCDPAPAPLRRARPPTVALMLPRAGQRPAAAAAAGGPPRLPPREFLAQLLARGPSARPPLSHHFSTAATRRPLPTP